MRCQLAEQLSCWMVTWTRRLAGYSGLTAKQLASVMELEVELSAKSAAVQRSAS